MIQRFCWLTSTVLSLFGCAGCAVNSGPDFHQAAARVEHSTGQSASYQPDLDDQTPARVKALLDGGLTADAAVQICLLNNRELQAAWMQIGMARADFVQS